MPAKPKTPAKTPKLPTRRELKQLLMFPALLIIVLTTVTFAPAQRNEFLNWDDNGEITNNHQVRSLSLDNVREIFSAPKLEIYHPLTTLSWALEYWVYQYDSEVVHTNNIILHVMNALLVLWLVFLITGKVPIALVSAALFAVHPLRVESVAWATERKDVLYGVFFFASLISYVYYVRSAFAAKYYVLALILMALSAFSKGMAVSLPLALIAFDFLFARKIDWWIFLEKIPFFVLALVFGMVAIEAQSSSGWVANLGGLPFVKRAAYASYALYTYLGKLLVPINLSAIYPHPDQVSWLVQVLPFAIAAPVLYSLRFTRKIAFGFLFFIATVVMVLPWMGVGKFVAADRLTYVSLFGLFYLAGEGFYACFTADRNGSLRYRRISVIALIGLVALYSTLSFERCKVWLNSYTLMSDIIEKFPNVPDAYINRAMVTPDGAKALEDYTIGLKLDPSRTVAYNNRGLLHYNRNEFDAAIQDYNEGIRRNPAYSNLYFNRMLYHLYHSRDYTKAWADMKSAESLGFKVGENLRQEVEKAYQTLAPGAASK